MWKKEISFKRKPKEPKAPKEAKASKVPDAPGEEPTSIWKKDISFKRKPKQVTEAEVESAPVSGGQGQVSDTETGPKESVWKEQIERAAEEIKRAAEPAPVEVETQTLNPRLLRRSRSGSGRSSASPSLRRRISRPLRKRRSLPPPTRPSRPDTARGQTPSRLPNRRRGRRRSASLASRVPSSKPERSRLVRWNRLRPSPS